MKKIWVVGFIFCVATPYAAYAAAFDEQNGFFPLLPRLSIEGMLGEHTATEGEAMLPLYGNQHSVFYADANGKTTFTTDWLGSAGIGMRTVLNSSHILGGYVFVDRNVSSTQNLYWFINPGIESLGKVWDFSANAYVPVSTRQKYIGTDFADHFNNYNYIQLHGHTESDAILSEYESVGWGVDAEIGRQFPAVSGLRWYVGGYHFSPDNAKTINGVSSRVEYPINNRLSLTLRDSYDNQRHNSALLGVRLTLGGVDSASQQFEQTVQQRLLDPIRRHLATQGQAGGEPVVIRQQMLLNSAVEQENIWFFQPNGGESFQDASSCTAEHPCSGFNQETVDGINQIAAPNPNFYFKPGQYNNLTALEQNNSPLNLTDDSLFGRSENYYRPEQNAVFNGALRLNGVDTLSSIILHNTAQNPQQTGLTLAPNTIVTLEHTQIGAINGAQAYVTGVSMQDSTLYLNHDSQINAYSDSTIPATGIYAYGQSAGIAVNNSQINANASGSNNDFVATGINAQGNISNTITLKDSQVNAQVSTTENRTAGDLSATGVAVAGADNTVELQGNSAVNVTASGANINQAKLIGIAANTGDVAGGINRITLQGDSQVNLEAQVTSSQFSQNNTVSVVGIAATTGNEGINDISLSDNSQILANITDGDSGRIGDALTLDGISTYGAQGSTNMIVLKDNSAINVGLDYDGKRSFSSHNTSGISAVGADNQITLMDNSAINLMAYVAPSSRGHNEVDEFGITTVGQSNHITLQNNAAIHVAAEVDGGNDNTIDLKGINALQGSNTIHLSGDSSITVLADSDNTATSNFESVTGIATTGVNTVNIQDQAIVTALGVIQDQQGFNTLKSQGINLDGISTVNLSQDSHINAVATANGKQPYAVAYGINSFWSQSTINDEDPTLANVDAIAIAPEGEAVAEKIRWGI